MGRSTAASGVGSGGRVAHRRLVPFGGVLTDGARTRQRHNARNPPMGGGLRVGQYTLSLGETMQSTWQFSAGQGMRYMAHYVSTSGTMLMKELANPDVQRHSIVEDDVTYDLKSVHHIPLLSEAEKRAARGVIAWR